jgi:hypothetical protein
MAEYPSPYHWAAFTLIGEMGASSAKPLEGQATSSDNTGGSIGLWIGGGVVLLALLGAGWGVRRRR